MLKIFVNVNNFLTFASYFKYLIYQWDPLLHRKVSLLLYLRKLEFASCIIIIQFLSLHGKNFCIEQLLAMQNKHKDAAYLNLLLFICCTTSLLLSLKSVLFFYIFCIYTSGDEMLHMKW